MTNTLTCKIEHCDKPVRIKKLGICQMHETRQRNYGDPNYKKEITSPMQCKIENCVVVVYNKMNQLCMKHYQQLRLHGNFRDVGQKKSLVPLHIPNGEIVWNIQKAKKIIGVISTLEKMVMCGYIYNWISLQVQIEKIIENGRYSKIWFYNKYIKPLIEKKEFYTEYLPFGEEISKLVDEIIEKGSIISEPRTIFLLNLKEYGIKYENNEYSFTDTIEDVFDKLSILDIDIDAEDYEICRKLKIHYKRYKKIRYTEK